MVLFLGNVTNVTLAARNVYFCINMWKIVHNVRIEDLNACMIFVAKTSV